MTQPAQVLFSLTVSRAPALHTLLTQLPAIWNPALCISSNPRLERIILNPNAHHHHHHHNHAGNPVVSTNLFLMEASKSPRLSELIRAGTNILHTRTHTMGTVCVSATVRPLVLLLGPVFFAVMRSTEKSRNVRLCSPYQYPLPNIPSHLLERQTSVYYSCVLIHLSACTRRND